MTVAPMRFADIPDDLLGLKPELNREAAHRLDSTGAMAFGLYEDGALAGVAWLFYNGLYDSVYVDTLILYPEHRSLGNLREAHRIVWACARGVANRL